MEEIGDQREEPQLEDPELDNVREEVKHVEQETSRAQDAESESQEGQCADQYEEDQNHQGNQENQVLGMTFVCVECGKEYKRQDHFFKHLQTHYTGTGKTRLKKHKVQKKRIRKVTKGYSRSAIQRGPAVSADGGGKVAAAGNLNSDDMVEPFHLDNEAAWENDKSASHNLDEQANTNRVGGHNDEPASHHLDEQATTNRVGGHNDEPDSHHLDEQAAAEYIERSEPFPLSDLNSDMMSIDGDENHSHFEQTELSQLEKQVAVEKLAADLFKLKLEPRLQKPDFWSTEEKKLLLEVNESCCHP